MLTHQEFTDPCDFKKTCFPFLLQNEVENNLLLGIVEQLLKEPGRYPTFYLGALKDNDATVGCYWMTPPYGLGLTNLPPSATSKMVEIAALFSHPVSGVVGPLDQAHAFAEAWVANQGTAIRAVMKQGVYQLRKVTPASPVPGKMRLATAKDRSLLVEWNRQFIIDCKLPAHEQSNAEPDADRAIKNQTRYLWEADGEIKAMTGAVGETPNGIRVGWVFTPPNLRGQGFASALVAAFSQMHLDRGKKLCFLFTDLQNPTSNGIYRRVGYEQIGESALYQFS